MFGKWLKAQGVVQALRSTRRGPHGITIRWAYVIEVMPPHEPAFRAEVKDPVFNGNFVTPGNGEHVLVEYKPGGKVRFDKSDPRRNNRKRRLAERAREAAEFKKKLTP